MCKVPCVPGAARSCHALKIGRLMTGLKIPFSHHAVAKMRMYSGLDHDGTIMAGEGSSRAASSPTCLSSLDTRLPPGIKVLA